MLLDILWPLEEWRFLSPRDSYQTTTKHAMHKWHWVMSLDKVARGNGIDFHQPLDLLTTYNGTLGDFEVGVDAYILPVLGHKSGIGL
jgi:hypothetical protein